MQKKICIGILGCARIADRSVIPALLALPDKYEIQGIASRNAAKAEAFASKYGLRSMCGYDRLLDENGLDAVYIPLPNSLHGEWIKKALDRNIHVLVEKSLACTMQEAETLNAFAERRKLVLVENFQFRFHRQLAALREVVASGDIGELRCIRSSFGFPPFHDNENIRYQRELGGGALLDAGAYPIKLAQLLMGYDLNVTAGTLNGDEGKEVDIWGGGFIRQNKGPLFAQIAFGFDNSYQCSVELWGRTGRLFANRIFTAPPGYESEILVENAGRVRNIKIPPDNHFQNMLGHFHDLATGKICPDDEYVQNINQARLIEMFREKSK